MSPTSEEGGAEPMAPAAFSTTRMLSTGGAASGGSGAPTAVSSAAKARHVAPASEDGGMGAEKDRLRLELTELKYASCAITSISEDVGVLSAGVRAAWVAPGAGGGGGNAGGARNDSGANGGGPSSDASDVLSAASGSMASRRAGGDRVVGARLPASESGPGGRILLG